MKNVTVSMSEEVARWARVHAARRGMSVSRMIGQLVEELMHQTEGYEAAMERHLTRERGSLGGRAGYPDRDELYDRGADGWGRPR